MHQNTFHLSSPQLHDQRGDEQCMSHPGGGKKQQKKQQILSRSTPQHSEHSNPLFSTPAPHQEQPHQAAKPNRRKTL
uniref:Uncharacterized protein n=1 Tax=Solanum lycopersicum TaxID=4081 RepID=A0A3Q7GEH0_SOLLC